MQDNMQVQESLDASVIRGGGVDDALEATGEYVFECYDSITGLLKWRDTIKNTVMTEGKNALFNAGFRGSSYSVTGPYMGLISAVGYSAIAAGDSGAQINGTNGWKEAGGTNAPAYTGNRPTAGFAAASAGAIALTSAVQFTFSSGTNVVVKGAFILFGAGALSTKDDAHGSLWAAGTFSGGDKTVSSGDILNVSYSTSI